MSLRIILFATIVAISGSFSSLKAQSTPEKSFKSFQKLWDDQDWPAIEKVCTNDAYRQLIVSNIRSAGMMLQHNLPFESDELRDMRDTVELLFEDYGFDNVDFKDASIVTVGEIGDEEMEQKIETQRKNLKKIDKQIIDILAKVKDRKAFDKDLLDVCTSSPFLGGTNTISDAEIKKLDKKDDVALMLVENDGDITHTVGNAQIVLKVPPRYLRFKKIEDVWKYDGIDEQKSAEAANHSGK